MKNSLVTAKKHIFVVGKIKSSGNIFPLKVFSTNEKAQQFCDRQYEIKRKQITNCNNTNDYLSLDGDHFYVLKLPIE